MVLSVTFENLRKLGSLISWRDEHLESAKASW
jgi:hypothetical protein